MSPSETQLKKGRPARTKGAENANRARTAWEAQAIAIYAQFLHERPALKPKERRYAVTKWMNENSSHPKRITDAMLLGALRRQETEATLAAFKEMFEAPGTDMLLTNKEEAEITAVAEELTRFIETSYSQAFRAFVEATAAFRAACIEASKTDFASEVQRAVQVVRDKTPARVKAAPAGK
jgi:hypothetical protein